MREVVCKECGKIFMTKYSRKMFCDDMHYRICEACGEPFYIPSTKLSAPPKTCSTKCRNMLVSLHHDMNTPQYTRICEVCGETFVTHDPNTSICYATYHYLTCEFCGAKFKATRDQTLVHKKTCSKSCSIQQRKQTIEERYPEGFLDDAAIQKQIATFKSRYGKHENPEGAKALQQKREQSCLRKYGARSFTQTSMYKDKTITTNQEKYGSDWYMSTDEFKIKSKSTLQKKYGADNISKSEHFYSQIICDPSKAHEYKQFKDDPITYIQTHYTSKPTLFQLRGDLGVNESSISYVLRCLNSLEELVDITFSSIEVDIFNMITHIVPESTIIKRNCFDVITPYELDIYLPDYKFAIECNPTYTHNSTNGTHGRTVNPIDPNYHRMKSDLCLQQGISLFHLFGYQYIHKHDAVESHIRNSLYPDSCCRVDLTQCTYSHIDFTTFDDFCSIHSLETHADVYNYYGIFENSNLLCVIPYTSEEKSIIIYDIICKNNYLERDIISYVLTNLFLDYTDVKVHHKFSHGVSSLYDDIGFHLVDTTEPNFYWINASTDDVVTSKDSVSNKTVQVFDSGDQIYQRR